MILIKFQNHLKAKMYWNVFVVVETLMKQKGDKVSGNGSSKCAHAANLRFSIWSSSTNKPWRKIKSIFATFVHMNSGKYTFSLWGWFNFRSDKKVRPRMSFDRYKSFCITMHCIKDRFGCIVAKNFQPGLIQKRNLLKAKSLLCILF